MPTTAENTPDRSFTSGRSLRNAVLYAGVAASQRALTFLFLPLYTRALSPSEYGELGIIVPVSQAAVILLSFGLDYAVFRNFFQPQSDPAKQARMVATLWTFSLVLSLSLAVVVSLLVAPWLEGGAVLDTSRFVAAILGAALFASATAVPLSLLRAQQRLREYVLLNGAQAVGTAGLTVGLVVVLDAGVLGWLVGVMIANGVTLLLAIWAVPFRRPRPLDRLVLRSSLGLGLPLVPHFLAQWALQLSDRLVLTGLVTTATIGIYTLGATLALPAMILVQSLNQGFMPLYAAAATTDEVRRRLPGLVTMQAAIVLAVCLFVALLGPCAVRIAAPAAYSGASELVPWIVLGYAFLGFYCVPMNGLSLTVGRTSRVWLATALGAATNLALIVVLVPSLGIEAAAIASAVGYLVLLLAVGSLWRREAELITYQWRRLSAAVVAAAATYLLATATTGTTDFLDALLRLSWAAAGAGLLLVIGRVNRAPGQLQAARTLA